MSRDYAIGAIGVFTVWTWIALFAAGLLLDSKPYRDALRTSHPPRETTTPRAAVAQAVLPELPSVDTGPATVLSSERLRIQLGEHLESFAAAALLFTPLNAAMLALLAALAGGCASRVAHTGDEIPKDAAPEIQARVERHLRYWNESPMTAMLRGFAVYLAVIAGVYVTGGDPFKQPDSDQYARFAGTLSLLAFVMGYDPTRLQELIEGVPRSMRKR